MINHTAPSTRRSTFVFALLLGGAAISYMGQSSVQILGHILALSGLVALVLLWPIVSRIRAQIIFTWCMGMLLVTLSSMLLAYQYATSMRLVIQSVMYPLVLAGLLLYSWRILDANLAKLAGLLACIGMLNGAVALLASTGVVTSWPLVGDISTGRYIFGTQIPSSAGLALNVNYYSTLQGTIFLMYAWFLSNLSNARRWYQVLIGVVLLASVAIGSSRGVVAAMMAAGLGWFAIYFLHLRLQSKLKYFLLIIALLCIGTYLFTVYWDWIETAFRFDRGLNFRDVIWSAGLQLWIERPLLGYGYAGATSDMLGELIGREGSLHSGYLSTLTRGGALLFVLVYGGVTGILILGLGLSRERWWRHRWPVAIVIFYLANSAIRSFNLGGLGLLPLVTAIALSVILYAKYLEVTRGKKVLGEADIDDI